MGENCLWHEEAEPWGWLKAKQIQIRSKYGFVKQTDEPGIGLNISIENFPSKNVFWMQKIAFL